VVAEIAFALVLLTGAGLMLRSFRKMRAVELGFRPTNVLTMTVDLPEADYPDAGRMKALYGRILAGLEGRPGIEAAGIVNWRPLGQMKISGDFRGEGVAVPPDIAIADKVTVSPGYFRAMGVRLLRGREFDARDDERGAPVAIVSRTVAERLWPGRDPVGRRISMESNPGPDDWLTVVGEVDDVLQDGITAARGPALYRPYRQVDFPFFLGHLNVVVRSVADPAPVAVAMRRALRDADPNLPVQGLARMSEVVSAATAEPLFQARLLSAFSVLGLLLSAIGVYGLLAYEVAQRRREIGVRMALGARGRRVIAGVLRRTLAMSALGVLLGAAGAVALTRVLRGFLFGVTPTDPLTFAAVALLLVLTGLVAGSLPARRAAHVDPAVVLRAE
jgi:putative ABC transport system permease protein